MISLDSLAQLVTDHPEARDARVVPLRIGSRILDTDDRPAIMATVNLSRDSTYRESVAPSVESAIRKARVAHAQGADLVDVGAESTTAAASRVTRDEQIAQLVPVISTCTREGIAVSVETYEPEVTRACLRAGAAVVNMTGARHQQQMFDLAAEHGAAVIICYARGADVRQITDVDLDHDPIPGLLEHFADRIELARSCGVEHVAVDPGMGFYYGNLVDPLTRARHQSRVLLNAFRLRVLGVPVCQALPHAFDLFEDQFRSAEGFFAVLARLGGAGVLRTHEVPLAVAVAQSLAVLDTGLSWSS